MICSAYDVLRNTSLPFRSNEVRLGRKEGKGREGKVKVKVKVKEGRKGGSEVEGGEADGR